MPFGRPANKRGGQAQDKRHTRAIVLGVKRDGVSEAVRRFDNRRIRREDGERPVHAPETVDNCGASPDTRPSAR